MTEKRKIAVLVCGGRDYQDARKVFEVLDKIHADREVGILVHGAANGADSLGEQWAKSRQVNYAGVPAKWNKHGRSAGPKRNKEMLDVCHIDVVVDFPGGRGTASMCRLADKTDAIRITHENSYAIRLRALQTL